MKVVISTHREILLDVQGSNVVCALCCLHAISMLIMLLVVRPTSPVIQQ